LLELDEVDVNSMLNSLGYIEVKKLKWIII